MASPSTAEKTSAEIARLEAATELDRARQREVEQKTDDWARYRANEDAEPLRHGTLLCDKAISDQTVREWMSDLDLMSRREPGRDLTVIFCSPGGSVYAGLMLFDFIQTLRRRGHHVTTVCYGYAASMGGVLLQAGDKRVIGANGYVMIHEPASSGAGKASEIKDDADHLKVIYDHLIRLYSNRSTLSAKQLRDKSERRDWWIPAEDALKFGMEDEVESVPPFGE